MSCTHNFVESWYAHYVECEHCGTLKSTLPDDPLNLYTESYWSGYHSTPDAQIYNLDTYLSKGVTKNNYMLSQIRCKRRTALEIGCFPGIFLKRLVEYGFKGVVGIDPIIVPQRLLDAYDIKAEIVTGFFPEVVFESSAYDLVAAADVLEHMFDPVEFLKECHRVCYPGGQLMLVTALVHDRTIDARMISPAEHVYLHSVENIKPLIEEAGFGNITITQWAPGHDVISARKV